MSEIKLCKDCKNFSFYDTDNFDTYGSRCMRNALSFVDGSTFPLFARCETERMDEKGCGQEAKYFEPKG